MNADFNRAHALNVCNRALPEMHSESDFDPCENCPCNNRTLRIDDGYTGVSFLDTISIPVQYGL